MGREENLAAVRRYLELAADAESTERDRVIREIFDERCDYYPVRAFTEAAPSHGHDEVIAYLDSFLEAWDHWALAPKRLDAIDDVRVLAQVRISAVGRGSGVTLDEQIFLCFWVRNGRILRLEDHLTERGAREGLGLDGVE